MLDVFQRTRARAKRVELDLPMERIARLAGVSVRTVERAVRRLIADGLLIRTYLPGPRDRVERKHSKWLVPYAPTRRGPTPWPVHGRTHGPWLPGERPVWARYAPKRQPKALQNRSEPEAISVSLSPDKMSTPSFPTGTGGGIPPAPPPEPAENSSEVRGAPRSGGKDEPGGVPPGSPPARCETAPGRGIPSPVPLAHPSRSEGAIGGLPRTSPNPSSVSDPRRQICMAWRESARATANANREREIAMRRDELKLQALRVELDERKGGRS